MLVPVTCSFAVQRHGIARVAPFSAVFYVARTARATFYVLRAPRARKSWLSTNATRRTWRLTSFRALPTKKAPFPGPLLIKWCPQRDVRVPASRARVPFGAFRPSGASPGNARAFPRLGPCRVRIPPHVVAYEKGPRCRDPLRSNGAPSGIRTRGIHLERVAS